MRVCCVVLCVVALAAPAYAGAFQSGRGQPPTQPPPAQGEFVPLSEVPPDEQIPAFTLVALAYGFVWVALIGYVWSVSRRLRSVERELARLDRREA
jgi:CcmD family protein